MEVALRESERMHRLTLDSIRGHAILTMDTEGKFTSVNAGAAGVLGYRDDELISQSTAVLFTQEDAATGMPRRELDLARRRGIAEDERWHVRKDGSRFWGSGLVTPLLDESEQIRGFTKVVRDMTERKQAEEALRDADRRKDEFLAMLAHELRNPLSSIQNAAYLVRHASLPPENAWPGPRTSSSRRSSTWPASSTTSSTWPGSPAARSGSGPRRSTSPGSSTAPAMSPGP